MNNTTKNRIIVLTAFLIGLVPFVSASGFSLSYSPFNGVIEMLSTMINIPFLKTTSGQMMFTRLMLFIVLFAVIKRVLMQIKPKKGGTPLFDNKLAGIVGFAFSAIGTLTMPDKWLMINMSIIGAVFYPLLYLAFVMGIGYVAVEKLRGNLILNFFGLIILFILFAISVKVGGDAGLGIFMLINSNWLRKKLRIE